MERSKAVRLTGFFKQLYKKVRDDDVQAISAQLTYYLILSFFPFLIFIMTLVGYANVSMEERIGNLGDIVPAEAVSIVEEILKEVSQGRSQTLLSFGMLATLWAASRGINAIIKGLNKAYDIEENRTFWKVRGISLLATLVLGIVILLSVLLLVFGGWVGDQLFILLNYPSGFRDAWGLLQYIVPLLVMTTVFTLLYFIAPNRKMTFKEVLPGAIFATVGWITTSVLFSTYVNRFGDLTRTYGSLGGVMVLLIWLYISSIIILIGGEINATLANRRAR
ncbi:MAG TPA: YihY/virulence factor BrkB family protein [Paenibacillus sp.]